MTISKVSVQKIYCLSWPGEGMTEKTRSTCVPTVLSGGNLAKIAVPQFPLL